MLSYAEIAAKLGTKDVSNVTPMAIAIEVYNYIYHSLNKHHNLHTTPQLTKAF